MRFKTKATTLLLSFGSLLATRIVKAVRADGVSLDTSKILACCKNHTKANAPLLLFPSVNG